MKKSIVKLMSLALSLSLLAGSAAANWSVSGSQIIDPNGTRFVFRGVNHAHSWFTDRTPQALKDIAATGANSVRVVLSNGTQWTRNSGSDVSNIISQCKANKLVCVLEVHDSTGYGESSAATHISKATEYWLSSDVKAAIVGQENFAIINIANEPFGNNTDTSTYTADTITAIRGLRSGGLTHMLMVDAASWGQDWTGAMRDNASTIFAADSLKNTVFSVHMYEVYDTASTVQSYLSSFLNKGLPIVVGEFGGEHGGKNVDEGTILQYSQDNGIGYIGWSWSGNGSCCAQLDIVNDWNPSSLSSWGQTLINSTNGIKATSRLATHFGSASVSSSSRSSSRSSIASSSRSSSSITSISSSRSSIASSSRSSSPSSSSSASVASGQMCNWYGTTYPVCTTTTSGWGWENQKSCVARTTCAAQPAPYGIVGATSSSSSATNREPTAAFTESWKSTCPQGTVTVSAASSADPDGDALTYEWSVYNQSSGVTSTHSGVSVTIAMRPVTNYTFTLTVRDGKGGVGTTSRVIYHSFTDDCTRSSAASSSSSVSNGSTCSSSNFNKTAAKGVEFSAAAGDCIKYNKSSGTLQIGSWAGVTSTYNITSGTQGITNTGGGWTSVSATNGDLYIKVVSASRSFNVKLDNW